MSTTSSHATPLRQRGILLATAFMLFSMFFGAGNLIFPPMLGASAGENFFPALLGFLIGGVILPILSVIAIAVSGSDVSDVSQRAGRFFGFFFPVLVYLSIGALYGLPRMGTVAYTTSFVPLTGSDSFTANLIFNALFFTVAISLAWSSHRLLDAVGRILTPFLLIFLAVLILRTLNILEPHALPAASDFAQTPMISGILQGYLTMDSIAALAFGIIVIRTLRTNTHLSEKSLVSQTSLAAIIAGGLLTVVYLGLGLIGRYIPNPQSYENGAKLLADAASLSMGDIGRIVFALTVLAACLTTAVGLLAACSGFFNRLIPTIPYRGWLIIFTLITFTFAILGLTVILQIAGPLIGFLYPIGITLVVVTLVAPLFSGVSDLPLTFRGAALSALIWSALSTVTSLELLPWILGSGIGQSLHSAVTSFLNLSPLQEYQLGWLVPVGLVTALTLVIDLARGNRR